MVWNAEVASGVFKAEYMLIFIAFQKKTVFLWKESINIYNYGNLFLNTELVSIFMSVSMKMTCILSKLTGINKNIFLYLYQGMTVNQKRWLHEIIIDLSNNLAVG